MMRDCRKYAAFGEQRLCMDSTVALLPSTGNQEVIDYFFKAEPYQGLGFEQKHAKSQTPRWRNYGGTLCGGEKAVGANLRMVLAVPTTLYRASGATCRLASP